MNRTPVCREFLRGSCRFGSRCKFSHNTAQQQRQQPTSPFGFGLKNQGQNQPKGGNYYSTLASQKNQPHTTVKEHRCNERKECKLQIKEDLEHEQPVFWRLTCYGHGKLLPNDIGGDVSFEELRAHAYAAGKQGMSFDSVVQNEKNMFIAKKKEFDFLLNNPYSGPLSSGSGGLFTNDQLQPDASKISFGSATPVFPSSPFKSAFSLAGPTQDSSESKELSGFGGVKQSGGFSFGMGASSGTANGVMTSSSPLPQSPLAPGFSFGIRASEPAPSMQGSSPQNTFSSSSLPSSGFGQNSFNFNPNIGNSSVSPSHLFGTSSPLQAVNEAEMSDSLPPFSQSNGGVRDSMTQVVTQLTNHIMPAAPLSRQHEAPSDGKMDVWLKARWDLGEVYQWGRLISMTFSALRFLWIWTMSLLSSILLMSEQLLMWFGRVRRP